MVFGSERLMDCAFRFVPPFVLVQAFRGSSTFAQAALFGDELEKPKSQTMQMPIAKSNSNRIAYRTGKEIANIDSTSVVMPASMVGCITRIVAGAAGKLK